METQAFNFSAPIHVMGIGDDGCQAIEHLLNTTPAVALTGIHVHPNPLRRHRIPRTLLLQPNAAVIDKQGIGNILAGAHILFIAADMVHSAHAVALIARTAKAMNILTVGVSPSLCADGVSGVDTGLPEWQTHVDAVITAPRDTLHATLQNAVHEFAVILDEEGHVNVDVEDVRTIMGKPGRAMIGSAMASGTARAQRAAEQAVGSMDLSQALGLLILVTAAKGSLKLSESRDAMRILTHRSAPKTSVIYGAAYGNHLGDHLRVTVIATGLPYPR